MKFINTRSTELIAALHLQPHPEGGWFREVFRSGAQVQPEDQRGPRSALTSIYFLLEFGQHSNWHRVASDEVWVYLEGDLLELSERTAPDAAPVCTVLGPVDATSERRPQHTIAAGLWQAARSACQDVASSQGYTLVTCLVGPGFDFADFTLSGQPIQTL